MLKSEFILLIIALYFLVLFLVSYFTGKSDSNSSFFKGNNQSPWYVVAFGMIGALFSGIAFMSIPGWVGTSQMSYMQVVFGYFLGHMIIAFVLIPLYYRYNVTSIYSYLESRFGLLSCRIGVFYFLISRIIITGLQLFLAAIVLQYFIFDAYHIPFVVTVALSILLIWTYTVRGGIHTIIWTDTLQTFFILCSTGLTIYLILGKMNWTLSEFFTSEQYRFYGQIFFWSDWKESSFFAKQFLGGIFISICIMGLDQNLIQKTLSCKNLKEAKISTISFAFILVIASFVFLVSGALLFVYADSFGIPIPILDGKERTDLLYPEIALNGGLSIWIGILFVLGLIAATYSSADSALTALTTSVCINFLSIQKKPEKDQIPIRKKVHLLISALLLAVVVFFKYVLEKNVIEELLHLSTYTYGPLLGMFAFGICTKKRIKDEFVPLVCFFSPFFTWALNYFSADILFGYQFGYELLIVNGIITFVGLLLLVKSSNTEEKS